MSDFKGAELPNQDYRIIPGLGTAVLEGEEETIVEKLSSLEPGEKVMILGLVLELTTPTEEEVRLLQKSQKEQREYGLVNVGKQQVEIRGERASLDDDEVWAAIRRLVAQDEKQKKRVFSHTHWNREGTAVFSGPDVTVVRHLSDVWDFECRLISWLPGKVFIFRGTMN